MSGNEKNIDSLIAGYCFRAIINTKGVHSLHSGIGDNLNILAKIPLYKGIKVNRSEDSVTIDISLDVEYGVKIPSVCWELQENIKSEIEKKTNFSINAINIHVMGVNFPR